MSLDKQVGNSLDDVPKLIDAEKLTTNGDVVVGGKVSID
jgi:hypothetical protein